MKKLAYSLLFAAVVAGTFGVAAKADTSPNNPSVNYWASISINGSTAKAITSTSHAVDKVYTTIESSAQYNGNTQTNSTSATVTVPVGATKVAWSGHTVTDHVFGNWTRGLKLDNGVLSTRW
ncbi:hypothetical protein [Clostridium intestinale]|uniref:hypothetical protein n=1 Tax=Clostridium intestinale TaxID=36845 RepID=UPI0028EE298B|nr:hypothetical protein [Clostridium intestinale]